MALITEDLEIPDVGRLIPRTRRWHNVKPCGTPAAARRHLRQRGTVLACETCLQAERRRVADYYARRIARGERKVRRNGRTFWTTSESAATEVQ